VSCLGVKTQDNKTGAMLHCLLISYRNSMGSQSPLPAQYTNNRSPKRQRHNRESIHQVCLRCVGWARRRQENETGDRFDQRRIMLSTSNRLESSLKKTNCQTSGVQAFVPTSKLTLRRLLVFQAVSDCC
jgi:hypothetical protein